MKEQLKKYFNRYVEFTNEEIDEVYSRLVLKTFEKKDFLLQEGQIC